MREVLLSYLSFLFTQVSDHLLWFILVLFGVPLFWLLLRLTNLLYEEKALAYGATLFGMCSVVSIVMFVIEPSAELFWRPLLILLAGIITYACVPPIFCGSQRMSVNIARRTFTIDTVTYPVSTLKQVSVTRCFNRTKRSCSMELYVAEGHDRPVSLYYETNNLAQFRKNVRDISNFIKIDYDSNLEKVSVENTHFGLIVKTIVLSLLFFCVVVPVSLSLEEIRAKKTLPEYKMVVIPKHLYTKDSLRKAEFDVVKPVFEKNKVQIVVLDGPYSTHFTGLYRKHLYSYPNQNYDYNIMFIRKSKMLFKQGLGAKELTYATPEYPYTKFLMSNCNRLCFIDNELKILYATNIETVDSRIENIQRSINMLDYTFAKRLEQLRIKEERRSIAEDSEEELD